ncbi:MAG: hypothetical protein EBU22_06790 [Actinobacteria bacterium]|nr:hypothetical protein [Actinomycetota bacterium]NCU81885.1 hypothetical protein [Acidimicrobiia bacterium]NBP42383.1 hypothetical protein [Actinomycetota bacterium]NBQ04987.1 hypothetical protein [Actinomycetota bacterium]NDC91730.1 hypothetical protein [Acidimicrobiia bacterium]
MVVVIVDGSVVDVVIEVSGDSVFVKVAVPEESAIVETVGGCAALIDDRRPGFVVEVTIAIGQFSIEVTTVVELDSIERSLREVDDD